MTPCTAGVVRGCVEVGGSVAASPRDARFESNNSDVMFSCCRQQPHACGLVASTTKAVPRSRSPRVCRTFAERCHGPRSLELRLWMPRDAACIPVVMDHAHTHDRRCEALPTANSQQHSRPGTMERVLAVGSCRSKLITTFGWRRRAKELSGGGSVGYTSSAAPPTWWRRRGIQSPASPAGQHILRLPSTWQQTAGTVQCNKALLWGVSRREGRHRIVGAIPCQTRGRGEGRPHR